MIQQPVIYQMSQQFNVIFNIRRAKINDKVGEMVLELEGDEAVLGKAIRWLKEKDIKVEPVIHDAVEG